MNSMWNNKNMSRWGNNALIWLIIKYKKSHWKWLTLQDTKWKPTAVKLLRALPTPLFLHSSMKILPFKMLPHRQFLLGLRVVLHGVRSRQRTALRVVVMVRQLLHKKLWSTIRSAVWTRSGEDSVQRDLETWAEIRRMLKGSSVEHHGSQLQSPFILLCLAVLPHIKARHNW